ncbi:MAG: isoprenylcysteine carboxylmethyltransferase family protein [Candidatus Lokiarchaeota archaeon]|nr:isoprenylcysteine carboxylmethyltransferase family protein [Candidatus Lokiarchaeota archaeon]
MIEWINFSVLFLSLFLFCYFYTLSIQPVKREGKRGERAWKECTILRYLSWFFNLTMCISFLIWIWFPIPFLDWKIHPTYLTCILIGIGLGTPFFIILLKAMKDAGSESLYPSRATIMYGGIYNYIRHPQTLGEFPMFVSLAFFVNSWFLVFLMVVFIIVYPPIMIYYEEKDLVRRFGDDYRDYQQRTGAIFPKIRKKS